MTGKMFPKKVLSDSLEKITELQEALKKPLEVLSDLQTQRLGKEGELGNFQYNSAVFKEKLEKMEAALKAVQKELPYLYAAVAIVQGKGRWWHYRRLEKK